MYEIKNITNERRQFRDSYIGKTIILEPNEIYESKHKLNIGPEFEIEELGIEKNKNNKVEDSSIEEETQE